MSEDMFTNTMHNTGAIMMLFFKLIRLWNNPSHEDTQQDIQGYLKIVEILKKQ